MVKMKTMKIWRKSGLNESHANSLAGGRTRAIYVIALAMLAAFSIASCSSDPEWADPEAHEKTEQLQKQYGPIIAGTWHIEKIGEKQRYFERLTFNADGTLKGMRKWQSRKLVTIEGKEQYTDWVDVEEHEENATFTGTWTLLWSRETDASFSGNRLVLNASFDGVYDRTTFMAYSLNALFINADESTLCFGGGYVRNGDNGETIYTRGDAEPSF